MICEAHKLYRGLRAPRASLLYKHGCPTCWRIYNANQARKRCPAPKRTR